MTVLLAEEDKVEDDVVFYLVFSGSTLHHYTSTRKVSSDTLETIAPGKYLSTVFTILLAFTSSWTFLFCVHLYGVIGRMSLGYRTVVTPVF